MKKFCFVTLFILTINHAHALSCAYPHYWESKATKTIYYGMPNQDSSTELARHNIVVTADKASFTGLKNLGIYAQDKNSVYLFGKVIPRANPKTWQSVKVLNNQPSNASLFGKDNRFLYFQYDALVHDGDLASIEVFDQHFSRDKNALYFNGYRLPNINPNTFKTISWKPDPPSKVWGWKCDFYPDVYIDQATDGIHQLSHQVLIKKYGSWRKQK